MKDRDILARAFFSARVTLGRCGVDITHGSTVLSTRGTKITQHTVHAIYIIVSRQQVSIQPSNTTIQGQVRDKVMAGSVKISVRSH